MVLKCTISYVILNLMSERNFMHKTIFILLTVLVLVGCNSEAGDKPLLQKGNVVFLHPDGTGVGHWNLLRLIIAGPDGVTNWDQMDRLGLYRPHQMNSLVTTSHAGATVHAYGKKVHFDSYGMDKTQPLTAVSGKPMSIMQEAMASNIRVGVVNSGHIAEPGTGVFLASSETRKDRTGIAAKILSSGANLIFSGGEIYTLPKGTIGYHGLEGMREDGRNLLKEAEEAGYTVIFSLEQLLALPSDIDKVIGIFAAKNTYNATTEEKQLAAGLPHYNGNQPRFDQMVEVALRILSNDPDRQFFLVAEEEGTDNFSNSANASGAIEALKRTDAAINKTMQFMAQRKRQDTLLIVAADSDAGHPSVWANDGVPGDVDVLPLVSETGAPIDGVSGPGTAPFIAMPDAQGVRFKFGVAWPLSDDSFGSVVAKSHGFKSELLGVTVDNSDIYKICYEVLFNMKL